MNNQRELAEQIMDKLFKKGIECMVYYAKTGSVYIALDNGAIGSIRISDHVNIHNSGAYRYNLTLDVDKMYCIKIGEGSIYMFPKKEIDMMIEYISLDKQNRLSYFGELGYNRYKRMMLSNYLYHKKGWKLYVPSKEILEEE